jgi:Protein of unknown function (DUF3761)
MHASALPHSLLSALIFLAGAVSLPAHAAPPSSDEAMVTCKDGSTSKAGHGACSHHGGVAPATAKCKDGTSWYNKEHSGACSDHGGVDKWLDNK